MPRIAANGIEIEYRELGSKDDPLMLLVSGFSGQLTRWPESFIAGLVEAGRRVVIFDNRDIGLSTEFTNEVPPAPGDIVKGAMAGKPMHERVPYILDDMAADAAGLIEALGADKADVLGVSMGGMIVQLMALNHPDKVRALIPVMTTSGEPSLPRATDEAQKALTAVPETRTAAAVAETAVKAQRAIGSTDDVRNSDEHVRQKAIETFNRSDRPMGVARQYAAILAQPRWHERLGGLTHPTLVLHGAADPLIKADCGRDIAARILGAEIEVIDKWGHDMPEKMVPVLLSHIIPFLGRHAAQAARADAQ